MTTHRSLALAALAGLSLLAGLAADPAKPGFTLYYTHDAMGYLESCGCAGPVIGLADMVNELMARRKAVTGPTLTLDGGNLSKDQSRGRIVWDALSRGGYDVVAFGPSDVAWQHEYWPMVFEKKLPVLVGPWFQHGNNLANGIAVPRWTKKLGDLTVGVTSSGPRAEVVDKEVKATQAVLAELRKTCDVVILVSYHDIGVERALVDTGLLGDADLVIGCRGCALLENPEQTRNTWFLPEAPQGRRFGQLKLSVSPADAALAQTGRKYKLALAYESITPKQSAKADDPIVADTRKQQQREARIQVAKGYDSDLDVMAKYGYVPSDRCATCHREQYVAWGRSRHAQAFRTLLDKKALRDECLPCHAYEIKATGKFLTPTKQERGVECIACHGNGMVHLYIPRKDTIDRGDRTLCVGCHTQVNDPNWDAEKRWAAIAH
ncbi:MAG: hypothetical protein HZB16_13235 [Armatimonadetes bacterium]|nr:hypothetical protein [Armatimonadota bacterium]